MKRKSMSRSIYKAAAECLTRRIPFAVTVLPNETSPSFICPDLTRPFQLEWDGSPDDRRPGFVITTFAQQEGPVAFIPREWDVAQLNSFLRANPDYQSGLSNMVPRLIDRDVDELVYLGQVKRIVRTLRDVTERDIAKVVLSRTKTMDATVSPLDVADTMLKESNPQTFFYICWHPETGVWCATTPEIAALYNREEEAFHTMALAGTQYSFKTHSVKDFSGKNIHEQQIVAIVIDMTMEKLGAIRETPLEEMPIGVYDMGLYSHLCTFMHYRFKPENLMKAVLELTPTPAVLGFPKQFAFNTLSDIELHDRRCYGGVVGLYDGPTGNATLFVNLRCWMALPADDTSAWRYRAFAGGGLLADSKPYQEWEETESKLIHFNTALITASIKSEFSNSK